MDVMIFHEMQQIFWKIVQELSKVTHKPPTYI